MASHFSFEGPEGEDDEFSNSEDERKLEKYRNSRRQEESDSEVEVFGVGSESDDQSDIALSDVEGQDQDDNLPDRRAWGREKKKYYGADYVDPDYGGFEGKDAQAAEIEEEEAKNLQSQLIQHLDDDDFGLDAIFKKSNKKAAQEESEELIKTDLTNLTDKQKILILETESPEFFALVSDFKAKMSLAKEYLLPILQRVKEGKIEDCKAVQLLKTYYQLILNYATNIYMYLLLKGANKLKNHPIIQRLYQYRQLLAEVEPVFEEVLKPQIELLVEGFKEKEVQPLLGKTAKSQDNITKTKKTLKLLAQLQNTEKSKKEIRKSDDGVQPKKKLKLGLAENFDKVTKQVRFDSKSSDEESGMVVVANESTEIEERGLEEQGKRAITYQIAKNKGLTPHRKKELRNPRVKHKLKFRKALIRRKGAVREPRKELSRYGGEISGIKATVSKSIKIKS